MRTTAEELDIQLAACRGIAQVDQDATAMDAVTLQALHDSYRTPTNSSPTPPAPVGSKVNRAA
jgi:hypothetical protein